MLACIVVDDSVSQTVNPATTIVLNTFVGAGGGGGPGV